MVADATKLAEAVRRSDIARSLTMIPRIFTWVCNISTKCATTPMIADLGVTHSLAEMVWRKYPGLCSLCGEARCVCIAYSMDIVESKARDDFFAQARRRLEDARSQPVNLTRDLAGWTAMFDQIYGAPHARLPLSAKALHFFEEIGELEVELRKADRVEAGFEPHSTVIALEDEIADVFSWLVSMFIDISRSIDLATRVIDRLEGRDIIDGRIGSLAECIWRAFGDPTVGLRCHKCEEPRCVCDVLVARR